MSSDIHRDNYRSAPGTVALWRGSGSFGTAMQAAHSPWRARSNRLNPCRFICWVRF